MSKITFEDYQRMLLNDEVEDLEILEFSEIVKGEGGFDFELKPDPEKVEMSPEALEAENARLRA